MERNDWYYWSKNRYGHFIVFRERDNQVARASIHQTPINGLLRWIVMGPCWTTYQETGLVPTLEEAKQAVDERVMKIIAEEFKLEYINPVG